MDIIELESMLGSVSLTLGVHSCVMALDGNMIAALVVCRWIAQTRNKTKLIFYSNFSIVSFFFLREMRRSIADRSVVRQGQDEKIQGYILAEFQRRALYHTLRLSLIIASV